MAHASVAFVRPGAGAGYEKTRLRGSDLVLGAQERTGALPVHLSYVVDLHGGEGAGGAQMSHLVVSH